jgi:hypothetical protein
MHALLCLLFFTIWRVRKGKLQKDKSSVDLTVSVCLSLCITAYTKCRIPERISMKFVN